MFIKLNRRRYKVYTDIDDLPVYNYNKAKKDLRYLLRLSDYSELPKIKFKLDEIWAGIHYQIIDYTGVGELDMMILHKIKEVNLLKCDILIHDNKQLITRLNIAMKQLEEIKGLAEKNSIDFEEQTAILESHFRVPFDLHKMSIKRYLGFKRLYEKKVNEQVRQDNK